MAGHECHEGRCTHRKLCSEVVSSLQGSEEAAGAGRVAATLTWQDLNVTVSTLKGKRRTVLFNASGYAEPGKLMAIMGPSGSGKSTLLDALAGRWARNATHTGEILLNGRKQQMAYGTAAYVTQDDILTGTLTVRETIRYATQLQLPSSMSSAQKNEMVEQTIAEMGLRTCADTKVGNWHLRGLSGGERRRLSIAVEVLTRPRLMYLDEPTSGLDSAAAFFVTSKLRSLARDGKTIVASIHQPSSEVFNCFDTLFLLSEGRTVYFGPASKALEYFAVVGFPCPPLRNPSDHFLRAINPEFDDQELDTSLIKDMERGGALENLSTVETVKILVDAYQCSDAAYNATLKIQSLSKTAGLLLDQSGSQAGFFSQTSALTRRSFRNMRRDLGYYWLRLIIYIALGVSIGSVFRNVGTSWNAIRSRAGAMTFMTGFLTFMSIGGFPSFVEDLKVFSRERLNGHYGVGAFVLANSISSAPFLFFISLPTSLVVYYLVGLHPGFVRFFYFQICLFASMWVVESVMMAIAALVSPNYLLGIIIGASVQAVYFLCSGFARLPSDYPKFMWKYPMFYVSFHTYFLQGMSENDFEGLTFENYIKGWPRITGEQVLTDVLQVTVSRSKWWNLAILFLMVFFYRVLFFATVKFAEKLQPWINGVLLPLLRSSKQPKSAVMRETVAPVLASPLHTTPTPERPLMKPTKPS